MLALWLPLAQQLHRCLAAGCGARLDSTQRAAAVDLLRVALWVAASPAAVDGEQQQQVPSEQQQQAKWQAAAEAWCKLADAVARLPPRGIDGAKHAEGLWASLAVAALQRIHNARCLASGCDKLFSRAAAKLCEMVRDVAGWMVRCPLLHIVVLPWLCRTIDTTPPLNTTISLICTAVRMQVRGRVRRSHHATRRRSTPVAVCAAAALRGTGAAACWCASVGVCCARGSTSSPTMYSASLATPIPAFSHLHVNARAVEATRQSFALPSSSSATADMAHLLRMLSAAAALLPAQHPGGEREREDEASSMAGWISRLCGDALPTVAEAMCLWGADNMVLRGETLCTRTFYW